MRKTAFSYIKKLLKIRKNLFQSNTFCIFEKENITFSPINIIFLNTLYFIPLLFRTNTTKLYYISLERDVPFLVLFNQTMYH